LFVKKLKYTTDNGRRQRWVQTGNTPLHQNWIFQNWSEERNIANILLKFVSGAICV
jgi:hypothetical protein